MPRPQTVIPMLPFHNARTQSGLPSLSCFLLLMLFIAVTQIGCGQPPQGRDGEQGKTTDSTTFRVETVVSGLEVPWAIAFAPDGRIFVNERPGRVRVVEDGQLRPQPIAVIADVEASGESGLMGLTLHPNFAQNHLLYLSYAYQSSGEFVRVVRYRETGTELTDRQVMVEGIPSAANHAGCRIRFGPDGKLYITTGDATDRNLAQQLNSLAGKTLRLNDDGSIPPDNPFIGQQGVRPEIWSYGHRNAQGIDWQPGSDLQFQTEHGPSGFDGPGGGDEVNIVEKGKNYGWPTVHHQQTNPDMVNPLLEYTPAVAPASGSFYNGSLFPQFKGNFFFGCLRGEALIRVQLNGRTVVSQERMLQDRYGRIRDVVAGPDGAIYFSTSNRDGRGNPAKDDDRIMKLVPSTE